MIKGQWVEYQFVIKPDANTVSEYYNGQLLSTHAWYGAGGFDVVAAIDLFGNGASTVYYDNLKIYFVPEPGSLSLLALGGLVLALRRKVAR
jgi:hypothetical protein